MPAVVNENGLCPILLTSELTPPWGLPLAEAGTEEAAWHLWDVIEDGYEPPRSDIDGYQPAADLPSWFIYLPLDEAENRWRRWVYFGEAADKTAAHAWDSESVHTLGYLVYESVSCDSQWAGLQALVTSVMCVQLEAVIITCSTVLGTKLSSEAEN